MPSDDLELLIGLAAFPLILLSHGGSLLSKGFATRTLSEFGREPLLLFLRFQLKAGHPLRHNFIPRNWRVVPYWDIRLGMGDINAKGPDGVRFAQGQDFAFTANMGAGARYNFNSRYSISAGLNYMHISNAGLSEPKVPNYGINVYGPMFGIDIQLPSRHRHSE
ncbi:MAG TPA: acyloxyacyl hydrolase [Candidatus Cybelea sp.]|nr:acyloxyacyl hydrolase [Candidatus Cybelea sp.]